MNECNILGRWPMQLTDDRVAFWNARENWERGRLEHMAERVEPGMVIYDCGSESGDMTALYRLWTGPEGSVVPIEPQPAYWPSIRQTWEANSFKPPRAWFPGFAARETMLDPFRRFLRDEGWPVKSWPALSSKGEVQPDAGFFHLAHAADRIPSIKLDDLADVFHLPPDIIVIDIEGAEWDCLEGSIGLLTAKKPLVYVSVHPTPLGEWYQRKPEHIYELMEAFGYEGEQLPHHGEGEEFHVFEAKP